MAAPAKKIIPSLPPPRRPKAAAAAAAAAAEPATELPMVALQRLNFIPKPKKLADEYLLVFPNNKHANRKDGRGMATLSPMQLGPVAHGQPGLPPALLLENFWQFSKIFEGETDAMFLAAQKSAFVDRTPHRHKKRGAKPRGWVWVDPETQERHLLDYITARQFYCVWYDRLARQTAEWKELKALVDGGQKVQICGYDGHPIEGSVSQAYRDDSKPFGHERALYTMLTVADEAEWPWNKYRTFDF
jgi:hypothetical protein